MKGAHQGTSLLLRLLSFRGLHRLGRAAVRVRDCELRPASGSKSLEGRSGYTQRVAPRRAVPQINPLP